MPIINVNAVGLQHLPEFVEEALAGRFDSQHLQDLSNGVAGCSSGVNLREGQHLHQVGTLRDQHLELLEEGFALFVFFYFPVGLSLEGFVFRRIDLLDVVDTLDSEVANLSFLVLQKLKVVEVLSLAIALLCRIAREVLQAP